MSIVQYIVVRGDLKWPVGALIAQGSHAAIAAIFENYERNETKNYLQQLNSMHKVVLKAENEQDLIELSKLLCEKKIFFHEWIEQPENIRTCIATAPDEKSKLSSCFRKFKLFN